MSLIGVGGSQSPRVISFNYTLKDSEGNLLDQSGNDPLLFLEGVGQILPHLESQIIGMLIGSKKTVKLTAENAYGVVDPSLFFQVPKSELAHLPLEVGALLQMNAGEQMQVVRVAEVSDDEVTLDGNHPLAGQDLEFDVELVDTRLATPEEIQHGHPHTPGMHAH